MVFDTIRWEFSLYIYTHLSNQLLSISLEMVAWFVLGGSVNFKKISYFFKQVSKKWVKKYKSCCHFIFTFKQGSEEAVNSLLSRLTQCIMFEEQNNVIGYGGKNWIHCRTEGKSKIQVWCEAAWNCHLPFLSVWVNWVWRKGTKSHLRHIT